MRRVTETLLREAGYAVVATANAEEALLAGRAGPSFDLLLTDVVMPGMSGRELARALEREAPGLPVVFVSGYDPEERAFTDLAALAKPFSPNQLLAAVGEALEGGRNPRDAARVG